MLVADLHPGVKPSQNACLLSERRNSIALATSPSRSAEQLFHGRVSRAMFGFQIETTGPNYGGPFGNSRPLVIPVFGPIRRADVYGDELGSSGVSACY